MTTATTTAAPPSPRLTPEQVRAFFTRLKHERPEPTTELEYTNPFTLLVAVVLAAQATDAGVNKATRALFRMADTPEKMLALGEAGLKEHTKTINFFNTKTKNVRALCEQLIADHNGAVPHDRAALERLPGVGRKTANVVLNVAFGEPTMPVDTHVFRVANRTGLAPGRTPLEVEEELLRIIPPDLLGHAHHWLILHGRYTCKAKKPDCAHCPVQDLCTFPDKT